MILSSIQSVAFRPVSVHQMLPVRPVSVHQMLPVCVVSVHSNKNKTQKLELGLCILDLHLSSLLTV